MKINQKFTLIELLVVVAIIGILASLLVPVLGKARQSARAVVCVSQYKQIGIALASYTDDNNELYPLEDRQNWLGQKGENWPWKGVNVIERPLNVYLGFTQNGMSVPFAKCPATEDTWTFPAKGSDYWSTAFTQDGLGILGLRSTDIIHSARMVTFDKKQSQQWARQTNIDSVLKNSHDSGKPYFAYLFADGHVTHVKSQAGEGVSFQSNRLTYVNAEY